MSILNYSFQWYSPLGSGILSPSDLRFFYYDIAVDNLSGMSKIYEWNDTIKSFLANNQLKIEDCEDFDNIEVDNGTILFEIVKDKKTGEAKETKAMAFFRHLRNAFAHYNIKCENDIFYIRDFDKNKQITMVGAINRDLLKGFCTLFLDQGAEIMQSLDNDNK